MSLTYKSSLIPSAGLEISLHLTFTCGEKETLDIMNGSKDIFYDWDYTGLVDDKEGGESSDTDDESFVTNAKDEGRDHATIILD